MRQECSSSGNSPSIARSNHSTSWNLSLPTPHGNVVSEDGADKNVEMS